MKGKGFKRAAIVLSVPMMPLRFLFVLGLLMPATARASLPGWRFTKLSELLPDQPTFPATRSDTNPSAHVRGVVWLADNPMVKGSLRFGGNAIAFWDRNGVFYLTPYPPDWSWSEVWGPSAWDSDVAFPLGAVWPPDAGPSDPHYEYAEMFYLDDQGLHRITWDQASEHMLPSLHEGKIAWQSRSAPDWTDDWEIYFWDGATTRRITDNNVCDFHPSLYGRTIAWFSGTISPEPIGSILYLSLPPPGQPGPLPEPVVVGPGAAPSLFKNKIAYHAFDGNDTEIFVYDIESKETLQITDNDSDDRNPSLFDGTIAWQGYPAGREADIFYWDGKVIHQLTDDPRYDEVNPSLWGTGLNTTIAYVRAFHGIPSGSSVVCARRTLLSVFRGPLFWDVTVAWPSVEWRTYRVEYSDDLVNWRIAADSVPSAGYGTTSWTDAEITRPAPAPSAVSRRFYRIAENP